MKTTRNDIFRNIFRRRSISKLLRQQAEQDFESARGFNHLELIRRAEQELTSQKKTADRKLKQAQKELAQIDRDQQKEFRGFWAKKLVKNITELNGIGPQLADRIIAQVFVDDLADLRRAHTVPGIGDERQRAINRWISEKERELSAMLTNDFPGKQQIVKKYRVQRQSVREQMEPLQAFIHDVEQKVETLRHHAESLLQVTADDFFDAFQNPASSSETIDHFITGIYAEWEAPPDWFKTLVLKEPASHHHPVLKDEESIGIPTAEPNEIPNSFADNAEVKSMEVGVIEPATHQRENRQEASLERNQSMKFEGQGNWVSDVMSLEQGVYKIDYQTEEESFAIDLINVFDGNKDFITYGSRKGSKTHHVESTGRFVFEIETPDDKRWAFEITRLT